MDALKHSEEDYNSIEFTKNQYKFIEEISKFLYSIIKIPESAIKGIVWKALREWQLKKNNSIAKISEMPLGKRFNALKEIFSISRNLIKRMLKDPQIKSELIIDIAFEKAFKYYLSYLHMSFC
ncbi:MAG: hypothetical protein ACFFCV_16680 [Promethearchaeota archaeon]